MDTKLDIRDIFITRREKSRGKGKTGKPGKMRQKGEWKTEGNKGERGQEGNGGKSTIGETTRLIVSTNRNPDVYRVEPFADVTTCFLAIHVFPNL